MCCQRSRARAVLGEAGEAAGDGEAAAAGEVGQAGQAGEASCPKTFGALQLLA